MKSLNRIGAYPISLPLAADEIIEFHSARLILLIKFCGVSGCINGLTKMAKLDFFTRYPDFYEAAKADVTSAEIESTDNISESDDVIESAMVRHHYGPWDKRYYHVLAQLEGKQLITVTKDRNTYRIALTDLGNDRVQALAGRPSFDPIIIRMRDIKRTFGNKSGNTLKNLIYRLFEKEVSQQAMGKEIYR